MLGPSVALFTVFVWIPILGAFALSFFAWNLNGTPTWVGLANYRAMLHDPLVEQVGQEHALLRRDGGHADRVHRRSGSRC